MPKHESKKKICEMLLATDAREGIEDYLIEGCNVEINVVDELTNKIFASKVIDKE